MKTSVKVLILLFSIGVMTSCLEEDDSLEKLRKQQQEEISEIEAYLTDKGITAEKFNDVIYKIEMTPGSGDEVEASDVVEVIVDFETFDDSTTFYLDSSYIYQPKNGFFFPKAVGAFPGPNYAIASMKENEVSRFIFTSNLMFGEGSGKYGNVTINQFEIIAANIKLVDIRTLDEQKEYEADLLHEYAVEKGYIEEDTSTADGFYQIILEEGTGTTTISSTATVNVDYKGYLLDGTKFDENDDAQFSLNGVIEGFKKGLQGLKKGSKVVLLIPSHMAYKHEGAFDQATGTMSIAPFSPLVFEITVNDF